MRRLPSSNVNVLRSGRNASENPTKIWPSIRFAARRSCARPWPLWYLCLFPSSISQSDISIQSLCCPFKKTRRRWNVLCFASGRASRISNEGGPNFKVKYVPNSAVTPQQGLPDTRRRWRLSTVVLSAVVKATCAPNSWLCDRHEYRDMLLARILLYASKCSHTIS